MKRKLVLRAASTVLALLALLAIFCGVTVTGDGFLDLSNMVRMICVGVAVVCGLLAAVVWRCAKPRV